MKRMVALLRRDMTSSRKDGMILYAAIMPLLLALGFRVIIPSFGHVGADVVVTQSTDAAIGRQLREYVRVSVVDDRDALDGRVKKLDHTVGVAEDGRGGYTLVFQGNETEEARTLPVLALQKVLGGDGPHITSDTDDLGAKKNIFLKWIAVFTGLNALFIPTIIMAFNIIEDKESKALLALGVSPLSKREYVMARTMLVVVLVFFMALGSLWLLGVTFDLLMVLVALVAGIPLAVLAGFGTGAISATQAAGMANLKFSNLAFLAPGVASLFLSDKLEPWVLGWLPPYWVFRSFKAIMMDAAGWGTVAPLILATLGTSVVLLVGLFGPLRRQLDFAR